MTHRPIMTVGIEREADIVLVRQRARRIADLLGFDLQDQTRIATAVSEIARIICAQAARGRAEFSLDGRLLAIRVWPAAPVRAALETAERDAATWPAMGVAGAQRLMDCFELEETGEAVVSMGKRLPRRRPTVTTPQLAKLAEALAQENAADPLHEIGEQNQALLRNLQEVKLRQEEASRLNEELERTNKGVVALYAELDRRAAALEELNATLEARVATAIAERERVEESLRQSQKMEAVGQLTGGIAHDFNNMLTGIIGSLEMLQRRLAAGQIADAPRFIEAATLSAQRAAALTHRLLAFSRRQSLDAQPVDVNLLTLGMSDLLRRTLGEHIGLELDLAPDIWPVLADSNQLESALLNLALNARDAMPDGGRLSIATACRRLDARDVAARPELEAGDYVSLAVRDTGRGMSANVVQRAFEPFFTTKPLGAGTGLGLSMVYGFARQSRGHVEIASRAGAGTCVTLLLPRGAEAPRERVPADSAAPARAAQGETVLVVEDETAVRMLVSELLHERGYALLAAENADAALRILRVASRIDLLVTDVGLPGMNGRQLADLARELRPELKVLFITGYAENAMSRSGFLAAGMEMIAKPFAIDALAEKIGRLIGG